MVLLWDVIEIILVLAILMFMVTQVFLPIIRGTPMYPFFKSKEPKLSKDLKEARQKVVESNLKKEVDDTKNIK
jgi:hypothetical protein